MDWPLTRQTGYSPDGLTTHQIDWLLIRWTDYSPQTDYSPTRPNASQGSPLHSQDNLHRSLRSQTTHQTDYSQGWLLTKKTNNSLKTIARQKKTDYSPDKTSESCVCVAMCIILSLPQDITVSFSNTIAPTSTPSAFSSPHCRHPCTVASVHTPHHHIFMTEGEVSMLRFSSFF